MGLKNIKLCLGYINVEAAVPLGTVTKNKSLELCFMCCWFVFAISGSPLQSLFNYLIYKL